MQWVHSCCSLHPATFITKSRRLLVFLVFKSVAQSSWWNYQWMCFKNKKRWQKYKNVKKRGRNKKRFFYIYGLSISLYVPPSVTLVYCDHTDWNSIPRTFSRLVSLRCSLSVQCVHTSVVISRPRSRDSSALEFIFQRSRDQGIKVLILVSRPKGQGLGLGLE